MYFFLTSTFLHVMCISDTLTLFAVRKYSRNDEKWPIWLNLKAPKIWENLVRLWSSWHLSTTRTTILNLLSSTTKKTARKKAKYFELWRKRPFLDIFVKNKRKAKWSKIAHLGAALHKSQEVPFPPTYLTTVGALSYSFLQINASQVLCTWFILYHFWTEHWLPFGANVSRRYKNTKFR